MFGYVPRHVYDDVVAQRNMAQSTAALLRTQLGDALRDLAEANRHAPRGEVGRKPKVVPVPVPVAEPDAPLPEPAPVTDPLPQKVAAVARRWSFGDERLLAANMAQAAVWRDQGMSEAEIVTRIERGEHVEPDEA